MSQPTPFLYLTINYATNEKNNWAKVWMVHFCKKQIVWRDKRIGNWEREEGWQKEGEREKGGGAKPGARKKCKAMNRERCAMSGGDGEVESVKAWYCKLSRSVHTARFTFCCRGNSFDVCLSVLVFLLLSELFLGSTQPPPVAPGTSIY